MTAQVAANDLEKREYFSAAELAELGLPGLPGDKRSITRRAQEERWASRAGADGALLVRPRKGRGGGVEFHFSLLPGPAQIELARIGMIAQESEGTASDPASAAGGWAWLERQPAKVRRQAEFRQTVTGEIGLLEQSGLTRSAAVAEVSRARAIGKSTLWSWLALIEGIDPANRLPALAPRRTGGGRTAAMDDDLWSIFKSDFLRPAEPTLTSCYRRTAAIAAERGLSMPSERTFRRRLEREIDPGVLTLRRKGEEALRRSIPAQRRHVTDLQVLECVNIDGHTFDVFVTPPPGSKRDKPLRPCMVALQDVRSSKIVGWRIGESESAALARLAFADMFRNFGIPRHCVLDNGRGFASKWITGGAASRFRFRIKPEEPTGLLTALGIEIHWALPYRGQSKPIERAFRDMCDAIAKHPAMDGAYTGNSPVNKPHDYGSRAVPWDEFIAHVEQGIAEHNARSGRRGRDYAGRSFDQVFEAGYASSPVAIATPEQLRMALLAAERKMVNRQTGTIELFGNRYWHPDCAALAGRKVTVRFDPDNLHSEVHLYGDDGDYLCSADVIEEHGFLDVAGAKDTARRWADHKRRIREGLEAERLLSAEELAAMQPGREQPELPAPGALRMVHHRGQTAAALKAAPAPVSKAEPKPAARPAIDRMQAAVLRLVSDD